VDRDVLVTRPLRRQPPRQHACRGDGPGRDQQVEPGPLAAEPVDDGEERCRLAHARRMEPGERSARSRRARAAEALGKALGILLPAGPALREIGGEGRAGQRREAAIEGEGGHRAPPPPPLSWNPLPLTTSPANPLPPAGEGRVRASAAFSVSVASLDRR